MEFIVNKLAEIAQQGKLRRRIFVKRTDKYISAGHKNRLLDFSSNDYLGLAQHDEVKKAAKEAIETYGVGSTSSAIVSGSFYLIEELEQEMAQFTGYPSALLFNSGYHANLAVMSLLSKESNTLMADKLVHASILDGISLGGAKLKRYPHQDLTALLSIQQKYPEAKYCITEGVFSMDGDISPLQDIVQSLNGTAHLVVDDAHGFGVLGQQGKGTVNHARLTHQEVPLMIIPCGKAMGAMGALVCGSRERIELLMQSARSYIFSTALAIPVVAALNQSLKLIQMGDGLRNQLFENISYFNHLAQKLGLNIVSSDLTPIRSVTIGENAKTEHIQEVLIQEGFLVSCIRPPTVPQNSARLRISITALHDRHDIKQLLDALVKVI